MTSVFKIKVRESEKELLKLLRTQTQASKRDRLRALYLHRTCQAKTRRQMAKMLGCAESTIYRWFKTYQNQGLSSREAEVEVQSNFKKRIVRAVLKDTATHKVSSA